MKYENEFLKYGIVINFSDLINFILNNINFVYEINKIIMK